MPYTRPQLRRIAVFSAASGEYWQSVVKGTRALSSFVTGSATASTQNQSPTDLESSLKIDSNIIWNNLASVLFTYFVFLRSIDQISSTTVQSFSLVTQNESDKCYIRSYSQWR